MFDLFRSREKSVRILLGALLVVVALSMLVYLIPGGPGGPSAAGQTTVAVVGDEKITTVDVQRAIDNVTRSQPNFPRALIGMYVPQVVEQLVQEKAMAYRARQMGLRVSDEELSDDIQGLFAQQLGKFDPKIYEAVLREQGMTVPDFEKQRREGILAMRLEALEAQALVVTDQEARAEYQRRNLKVGLQYIDFSDKDFAAKVSKDPAALKAYFDKNRAMFRAPETRDALLVVGATADFLSSAQVPESRLKQEYQDNIDSYRTPERVKVRHILIKTQGKPKEDVPKLKAKAEDILKQLQGGADFAELAKKDSEDPGSAKNGGELGWVVRGQTVPAFEKSAFSLPVHQLSGLVETEYGYHLIQVEEKQDAHVQSFDEVRPQLEADLRKQIAQGNLKTAVDNARAEIGKDPKNADAIAQKYHLKIDRLQNFTTAGTIPDLNSPDLANAIFSARKGGVTDVVDVSAQGKAAFALITNVTPAHDANFADVQNDVVQKYTTAESAKLAQAAAKAAADRARKGESLDAIAKSYGLSVKAAAPFTVEGAAEGIGAATMLQAAFKSNVGDVVGPVAAQNGQFVCKVSEKIPADMTQFAKSKDSMIQSLQTQKQSLQGPLFRNSIVQNLKNRGKIKMNQDTMNRLVSSYQQS